MGTLLRSERAQYRTLYRRAGYRPRLIAAALREVALEPARSNEVDRALLKTLPGAGRVAGAYMARCVTEQLGGERLAASIGDPAAFWRAYDRAAAAAGAQRFSAEALQVVGRFDRRFRQ
jgi:hypothetical protein